MQHPKKRVTVRTSKRNLTRHIFPDRLDTRAVYQKDHRQYRKWFTVVSRMVTFPDGFFPGKTFPGKSFPG